MKCKCGKPISKNARFNRSCVCWKANNLCILLNCYQPAMGSCWFCAHHYEKLKFLSLNTDDFIEKFGK